MVIILRVSDKSGREMVSIMLPKAFRMGDQPQKQVGKSVPLAAWPLSNNSGQAGLRKPIYNSLESKYISKDRSENSISELIT